MNEVLTPSDPANTIDSVRPLSSYLQTRQRWMDRVQRVGAPWEVGTELTTAFDVDLTSLAKDAPDLTVLAVGGYGRRELCLFSDIDLLLLHDGQVPEEQVRSLLYPIWDSGIKVGHATRNVRSTLTFARDDFPTLCTLLSARLVCGPASLLDELNRGLASLVGSSRVAFEDRLAAEEREVWRAEPFALQALDLKRGRGGLRSLHRLQWDRRRSALLQEEPVLPVDQIEHHARQTLLGVRAALHAVHGRADDRYPIELREQVGKWLEREPIEVATEVYRAARSIDAKAGIRWARFHPSGGDPLAHAGLAVARFVRSRWGRAGAGEAAATPFGFARAASNSLTAGRLSAWETDFASKSGPPEWTAGDRGALLSLLAAGSNGWEAMQSLWEAGWLTRAIPEISHLAGLAQAAPFHRHPADAHLGATVNEVVTIADHAGTWTADLADEIGGLDEVLLAAFLHDAGKGIAHRDWTGPEPAEQKTEPTHSEIGADLARGLLLRTGFGDAAAGLVGRAVRYHLLLPDIASRMDIDDPAIVERVAVTVADLDLLRVLALLSVADARATGPDMWSPWKETLIRSLYTKAAARLAGTASTLSEELERAIAAMVADLPGDSVSEHLAQMPQSYVTRFDPGTIASHMRLALDPLGPTDARSTAISASPVSTFLVAARDRPGLLSTIAGVLSLHNLNVLEARVATRSDGVALDTFRVEDALGSDMVGQGRWPGVRSDLEAAMRGELDLETRLAAKKAAYRRGLPGPVDPTVLVRARAGGCSIEVRTQDRVGLLYDLAAAMSRLGLDVDLAKIETRDLEAIDVFEVSNPLHRTSTDIEAALKLAAG